jgi:hypothetical protein
VIAGSGGAAMPSGSGGAAMIAGSGGAATAGTGGADASTGSGGASVPAGDASIPTADGGSDAGANDAGTTDAGSDAGDSVNDCLVPMGSLTYTLVKVASPTPEQQMAYDKITSAMDSAVAFYSCHTDIVRQLSVSYEPSVSTADGNVNGSIRFGSTDSMNDITAMHEIAHTAGIGSSQWAAQIMNGVFPGAAATAQLREITGNPDDVVHGDSQHFWPYGLNYTSEVMSDADLLAHCKMVMAIRKDLGL